MKKKKPIKKKPQAVKPQEKIFYGVWIEGESYWNQYESIADAVSDIGDGAFVYEMTPRPLGKYKREVSLVKLK